MKQQPGRDGRVWIKWQRPWGEESPSPRQIAYAIKLGIEVRPEMTKGQLSILISAALEDKAA